MWVAAAGRTIAHMSTNHDSHVARRARAVVATAAFAFSALGLSAPAGASDVPILQQYQA
jgi:hypothetical protein